MVHDPAESQVRRDRVFLVGHVHDLFKICKNAINVGVDVWDYRPVSLADLLDMSRELESGIQFLDETDQREEK